MKHTKILTLFALLFGMAAEGQAQIFQVFQKDGSAPKFQAAQVDSLSHSDAEGLTTVHLKNGKKETFQKAVTDSVVWYDPTNSILSTLRKKGNYSNFLRLVQENEWWSDMMNGATELTVLAADDAAWQRFFAENAKLPFTNPWHFATNYNSLLPSQKTLLLYSSIAGDNVGNEDVLRSKSLVAGLEALEYLPASEVPVTYSPNEKWYWQRFHEWGGGAGLYLASDSCFRYTSILTPEKAKRFGIAEQDRSILFPRAANSMANGLNLSQQDVSTNGILYSVAAPLMPLQSMADVIRTNGRTDIFSHILDRFSAPFYSPVLTESYRMLYPEFTDSIFIKRYFSDNNFSVKGGYLKLNDDGTVPKFEPGPGGTYQPYNPYKVDNSSDMIPALKFDPGWAGYYDEAAPENDMAAMFVPSDDAMWDFFTKGAGQGLLHVYFAKEGTENEIPYTKPVTQDELFRQIDYIPVSTLGRLINNFMMRSFVNSVPSKWRRLTDDAMEPMFDNVDEALSRLDTCLLANNGMVYVMDKLCLPADYTSVAAPAFISNTSRIIKSAIYDDYLNLYYYAYLKAPQRDITFFLPCDTALLYYYDPASMKSRTPRAIEFRFEGGSLPIKMKFRNYYGLYNQDKGELGTIGNIIPGANLYTNEEIINHLKDILFSHTIVNDGTQDIHSRNEYYQTFGGDVVKVVRDASGNIIGAKGTFQLENERNGIDTGTPGVTECFVTDSYESLSNGQTYTLNAPLVPTCRSLWSIMTNDADMVEKIEGAGGETPYSEFYKLCATDAYQDIILGCGLVDKNLSNSNRKLALMKYLTFITDNGLDYNFAPLIANTPYTAYIPTNEAVRRAIAQGLPTWEDIDADYRSHCKPVIDEETGMPYMNPDGTIEYSDSLMSQQDSIRIAGKITTLVNVIRAHFHYGMAIADQEPFQREYKSLCLDEQTLASPKVKVNCTGSGRMTVTDWEGRAVNVVGEEKNIFVHDYTCSSSPVNAPMRGITIYNHRPGVVHQIDGVLGFTK